MNLLYSSLIHCLIGAIGIILAGSQPAKAQTSSAWAEHSCARISGIYNSCGKKFEYDGRKFLFSSREGQTNIPCSDGQKLGFYERLEQMDMASIFLIPYERGLTPLPEKRRNWDPGRLRSEELLKAVFGRNEAEVRTGLVKVTFLGQEVLFQKRLGAAAALKRVSDQLESEMKTDDSLAKFLEPFTSKAEDLRQYTFVWRFVKGTTRLSTHSFGTGIDLLRHEGPQYWLWDEKKVNPEKAKIGEEAYRHDHYVPGRAPQFHKKAVEIFERNGFIWGGKWNHYDTMHFEYRPEFIDGVKIECPART